MSSDIRCASTSAPWKYRRLPSRRMSRPDQAIKASASTNIAMHSKTSSTARCLPVRRGVELSLPFIWLEPGARFIGAVFVAELLFQYLFFLPDAEQLHHNGQRREH